MAPPRGGRFVSKKQSQADLFLDRLRRWPTDQGQLWEDVKFRAAIIESKGERTQPSSSQSEKEHSIQAAAVAALRDGDVHKALRIITDAPLAPKNEATLAELRKLHPAGNPPHPQLLHETVSFNEALVKTAGTAPSSFSNVLEPNPPSYTR